MDVTIAGVTDKVPTCYNGYGNTSLLFMNQKGFESLWADGKSGNELKPGYASYSAYVVAENADDYQDTFEKETEENPEYSQISFYVSNLDKEMQICFFGGGDANLKDEGEANFQMVKDNLNPDEVQSYSAYIVTDDGEVMATRNNPDRVTLPANFKGYVIYDITDYRNSWASEGEDNTIDLSKTSIKTVGLHINANDVDVEHYLAFDNFFICGEGVTNEPGDIATTTDYVQLDPSMFYGVDINSLDNISPYPDQGGTTTTPSATDNGADQTAGATDGEETTAPEATSTASESPSESAGFPVWAWIVIAVVVVIIIVVIIVAATGKKNKGENN